MKKVICFLTGTILLFSAACVAPEEWSDVYDKNIVPDPAGNVRVENVNGGAIITFRLPSTNDLLGAKAVYALTPEGEPMERWASATKDTIVLDG